MCSIARQRRRHHRAVLSFLDNPEVPRKENGPEADDPGSKRFRAVPVVIDLGLAVAYLASFL